MLGPVGACPVNETTGSVLRAAAFVFGENGPLNQAGDKTLFIDQVMRADFVARR